MSKTILYTVTKSDLKAFAKEILQEAGAVSSLTPKNIKPYSQEDKLTQKQAAIFLGRSVTTIIDYKKKKIIPFHKMGNNIFYYKSELLEASRKGLLENKKA